MIDGRYAVHSKVARGGMSTVYLATDRRLDRRVALKVLLPQLALEPGSVSRFEEEARSAARLSHPHVVGVLDQGVDEIDGQPVAYLVMEFVRGRTLREDLRDHGRLTPRRTLALLDPVVEGLAAAHDAGLIHRDLKPENVLLSGTGQVKLADFGLARALSASTGTATLTGTAAYIAPEIVLGEPAQPQSDIYSIGVMAFELLTGHQPFTGDSPFQVALQHARADVPAPSTLLPGLASDIDELVQWCTSRDPDRRPVDGAALLGELRHIRPILTDEDLDHSPAAPPAPAHQDQDQDQDQDQLTAVVIRRPGPEGAETHREDDGSHTRNHTRVIRPGDATRVLAPMPQRPPVAAASPTAAHPAPSPRAVPEDGTTAAAPPRARRSGARQASRRAQARAAQRPEKSLYGSTARRSRRLLVVLLLLLAVVVAGAGWFFGAGPAGVVSLPDVARVPLAEARAVLDQEGLNALSTEEVFDDEVLAGLVIATDPEATTRVRRFERVELIVSRGPEPFPVPDVVGSTELEAAAALGAASLTVGAVDEEYSEEVGPGRIIGQAPVGGVELRRDEPVDLRVSLGPAPVAVPDVVGLTEQEAVRALERAGLEALVDGTRSYSPTVPVGAVVKQVPSGAEVERGAVITLTLSRGPRLVEVPGVFSLPEDRAVEALEAAGFTVEVDYTFGSAVLRLVAGQSPTGEQPEGSTIRITVT